MKQSLISLEDTVGKFQAETVSVKEQVLGLEKHVAVVEGCVKNLEADVDIIGRSFDTLETTVENLDNTQRKNNLKICSLKEHVEGILLISQVVR